MAVYDKEGGRHHSISRMRMHESKKAKPAEPKADAEPEKKPMEDNSGEDIKSVVAEHGPAHEMHYKHDEATGKHHVHSKHGEKEHHSEHDSPEDAADHMKSAMDQDEPADEEMGEEAGEAMPEMEAVSSHRIPGLS